MKRFFLALLLLVFASTAFADSIDINYGPNDGAGDNFSFVIRGQNFFLSGGGGTPYSFFNVFGYPPGTTLGGQTPLFGEGGGSAQIGGVFYTVDYSVGTLFMSTIVLPNNGRNFNAFVTISFGLPGIIEETNESISGSGGQSGYIYFTYSNGLYAPSSFVAAPEPGTLALVGTGLSGLWLGLRKRRLKSN